MFSDEVIEELNYYVYKLIDPRNGQVFYIGKGRGNRVFQHMSEEINFTEDEDCINLKISTIREIRSNGLSVIPIIHRHGMNEETAFEVEAALIDATPGLTNIQDGHGNHERGSASVQEIITKYTAERVTFDENVIVIKVRPNTVLACNGDIYEAGRNWWRLNRERAARAELAIISVQGIIRGVYTNLTWRRQRNSDRIGFTGEEASQRTRERYIGKRIPTDMLRAQIPTIYNYE